MSTCHSHIDHSYKKECPVTGKPIPGNFIWTDHEKPGDFNSCGSCSDPSNLKTLKEINLERK